MENYPGKTPKDVKDFFDKGGYGFLSELEQKYECASVCNRPLFYITRDIEEGRPERECIEAIYKEIAGEMKVEAAFAIILALILFCAMMAGIVVCMSKKDLPKDEFDDIQDQKRMEEIRGPVK